MNKRNFLVLWLALLAAIFIVDDTHAVTRPLAFVPTGSGFIRVTSGSEQTTASAVTLSGSDVSGTLSVANGGTGTTSLAANYVLLGNGLSAPQTVAPSTNGNVLTSNGTTWISSPVVGGGTVYGTYASRPAAGTAGRRYVTSDCPTEFIDDGTEWRPLINSRIGKAPPSVATFSQITAGSITGTTFADTCGSIAITWTNASNGGEFVRLLYRTKPASGASGYRITFHVRAISAVNVNGSLLFGSGWRASGTGNVALVDSTYLQGSPAGSTFHEIRYSASSTGGSPTYSFSAQTQSANTPQLLQPGVWMRTEHNTVNGNRTGYWSHDGVTWSEINTWTSTANTFITPDQIVLHCWLSNNSSGGATNAQRGCWFDSFEESTF